MGCIISKFRRKERELEGSGDAKAEKKSTAGGVSTVERIYHIPILSTEICNQSFNPVLEDEDDEEKNCPVSEEFLTAAMAPEIIDISDIMKDLEEEVSITPSPMDSSPRRSRTLSPLDSRFFTIRTVEEVDKCLEKKTPLPNKYIITVEDLKNGHNLTTEVINRGKEIGKTVNSTGIRQTTASEVIYRGKEIGKAVDSTRDGSIATSEVINEGKEIGKAVNSTRNGLNAASEVINQGKENRKPAKSTRNGHNTKPRNGVLAPLSQTHFEPLDISNLPSDDNKPLKTVENSCPLFDPDLVEEYERALKNSTEDEWVVKGKLEANQASNGSRHFSSAFEEICPPKGEKSAVLYTTTLQGIRKTFEQCNTVRVLVQSFGVKIDERDISMHPPFRKELCSLFGGKAASVPRLFIKGRHIGGAEEVARLVDECKFFELLAGIPMQGNGMLCHGCGGVRFLPCSECSGSRKVIDEENKVARCLLCNENGLIQCPICT